MRLGVKRAVPGRFVKGRFVPNPRLPKLGSGKRFERCVQQEIRKGTAFDPSAVCAARGIRKYGKKKMGKLARAGKKHHHNPKGKIKTRVVKRGEHWFMEFESAGGGGSSRYDSKAEAKKAEREYRYIHRTGRFPKL